MGFKSKREGYYLVPIADIETLVSLNECTSCYCSCGDCGDLDRVIQRIAKNKRRVNVTSTLQTALVQSGKEATISKVSAYQHEIDFLDEEVVIEPLK